MLGFHETDAFPGLNGEVMVTVYQGSDYWEFTLEPTETITFVYEQMTRRSPMKRACPLNSPFHC
ncbi:MAG: hypothetical protein R3E79_42970 [Caldilineaceae bacterium]